MYFFSWPRIFCRSPSASCTTSADHLPRIQANLSALLSLVDHSLQGCILLAACMRLSVACAPGHNIFSECSLTYNSLLTGWLFFVVSFVLTVYNWGDNVLDVTIGLEAGCVATCHHLGKVLLLLQDFFTLFFHCSFLLQKVKRGETCWYRCVYTE